MDDFGHGEASLQNDPAKFRNSMVSGVFCSQVVLPFCSPNSLQKGVLANLVLAGDDTDDTHPDQDHQMPASLAEAERQQSERETLRKVRLLAESIKTDQAWIDSMQTRSFASKEEAENTAQLMSEKQESVVSNAHEAKAPLTNDDETPTGRRFALDHVTFTYASNALTFAAAARTAKERNAADRLDPSIFRPDKVVGRDRYRLPPESATLILSRARDA